MEDFLLRAREIMLREHLKERGVTNPRVLEVFREVPREQFIPPQLRNLAYEDTPLDIGERLPAGRQGQIAASGGIPQGAVTISQPYTVAFMTQLLDPRPSDVVLEVGTGSGYQAAILSRLVKKVYTIERFPELAEKARGVLRELGYANVEVIVGDGSLGFPTECAFVPSSLCSKAQIASFENFKFSAVALFDGIIVTAGAPRIPEPLLEQLAEGGRLVIPVAVSTGFEATLSGVERVGVGIQAMIKITKTKKGLKREEFPGFRFVPLVGKEGFAYS